VRNANAPAAGAAARPPPEWRTPRATSTTSYVERPVTPHYTRGRNSDRHSRAQTPVVIFQAIAGKALADGPMDFELNRPGQWAFYDTGVEHDVKNLGDAPIELLEIEVR